MGSGASLQAGVQLFVSFVFLKKMATIRQSLEQEKYVWMEIPHTLHAWKRSEAKAEMYGLHVHGTRMHARTWLALGGTRR